MNDDGAVLILHVLPLAIGAAVSPAILGVSVEILLAFGSRGARMLLDYLVGAAVTVVGAGMLTFLLPEKKATAGSGSVADIVDVVLGAVLVAVALVLAFRRPGSSHGHGTDRLRSSRWAGVGVFGLGIVTMVMNVSTLVLILAGAREVDSASVGPVARGFSLGLLALGALAPILLPLLWLLVRPAAAARELQRLSTLLSEHGRAIGVTVFALTGGYLVAHGFGAI